MGPPSVITDWSFARRPFWIFSHIFAATVIVSFAALGLWQLSRHQERAAFNDEVEARSSPPALPLAEVIDRPPDLLNYQLVTGGGSYLDDDVVRVANRTQGGVAGEHVIGLFRLDDGRALLVNRGFVPLNASGVKLQPAPSGQVRVTGWLRRSVERGLLGATDTGQGDVVPRLDVAAIEQRLAVYAPDLGVVDVWLQIDDGSSDEASLSAFPDPVPLPSLDRGPHLSYMGQWFIFAILGTLFYGALLRRTAHGRQRQTPAPIPAEPDPVS